MTLLARFDDLDWAGGRVSAWLGTDLPDLPATSACAFVTDGDRLLLVDVLKRGWDLPGGHLDPGEDAPTALLRELDEEAGLTADRLGGPELLGWLALPAAVMPVYRVALLPGPEPRSRVPEEIGAVRVFEVAELPEVAATRIWAPFLPHLGAGPDAGTSSARGTATARGSALRPPEPPG